MQTDINLQMLPMHPGNALLQDRWQIEDNLARAFTCSAQDASINVWRFSSLVPSNPRSHMFVASGIRLKADSVVQVFGANGTPESFDYVFAKIRDALHLSRTSVFAQSDHQRIPWSRFAHVIAELASKTDPAPYLYVPAGPRNVKTTLNYIADLGNLLDQTAATAMAVVGREDLIPYGMEVTPNLCRHLGLVCRNTEIEGVFWPERFWLEAVEASEIFQDSSIPPHYILDGPQLWYFEKPYTLHYDRSPNDKSHPWLTSAWRVSGVALLPITKNGEQGCYAVYVFEHRSPSPDNPDEMLPRVAVSLLRAEGLCKYGLSCLCMAGLEFMNEVVPKTSAEYSAGAKKEARRSGKKLQPYSIIHYPTLICLPVSVCYHSRPVRPIPSGCAGIPAG